jgi:hypothetical protein
VQSPATAIRLPNNPNNLHDRPTNKLLNFIRKGFVCRLFCVILIPVRNRSNLNRILGTCRN